MDKKSEKEPSPSLPTTSEHIARLKQFQLTPTSFQCALGVYIVLQYLAKGEGASAGNMWSRTFNHTERQLEKSDLLAWVVYLPELLNSYKYLACLQILASDLNQLTDFICNQNEKIISVKEKIAGPGGQVFWQAYERWQKYFLCYEALVCHDNRTFVDMLKQLSNLTAAFRTSVGAEDLEVNLPRIENDTIASFPRHKWLMTTILLSAIRLSFHYYSTIPSADESIHTTRLRYRDLLLEQMKSVSDLKSQPTMSLLLEFIGWEDHAVLIEFRINILDSLQLARTDPDRIYCLKQAQAFILSRKEQQQYTLTSSLYHCCLKLLKTKIDTPLTAALIQLIEAIQQAASYPVWAVEARTEIEGMGLMLQTRCAYERAHYPQAIEYGERYVRGAGHGGSFREANKLRVACIVLGAMSKIDLASEIGVRQIQINRLCNAVNQLWLFTTPMAELHQKLENYIEMKDQNLNGYVFLEFCNVMQNIFNYISRARRLHGFEQQLMQSTEYKSFRANVEKLVAVCDHFYRAKKPASFPNSTAVHLYFLACNFLMVVNVFDPQTSTKKLEKMLESLVEEVAHQKDRRLLLRDNSVFTLEALTSNVERSMHAMQVLKEIHPAAIEMEKSASNPDTTSAASNLPAATSFKLSELFGLELPISVLTKRIAQKLAMWSELPVAELLTMFNSGSENLKFEVAKQWLEKRGVVLLTLSCQSFYFITAMVLVGLMNKPDRKDALEWMLLVQKTLDARINLLIYVVDALGSLGLATELESTSLWGYLFGLYQAFYNNELLDHLTSAPSEQEGNTQYSKLTTVLNVCSLAILNSFVESAQIKSSDQRLTHFRLKLSTVPKTFQQQAESLFPRKPQEPKKKKKSTVTQSRAGVVEDVVLADQANHTQPEKEKETKEKIPVAAVIAAAPTNQRTSTAKEAELVAVPSATVVKKMDPVISPSVQMQSLNGVSSVHHARANGVSASAKLPLRTDLQPDRKSSRSSHSNHNHKTVKSSHSARADCVLAAVPKKSVDVAPNLTHSSANGTSTITDTERKVPVARSSYVQVLTATHHAAAVTPTVHTSSNEGEVVGLKTKLEQTEREKAVLQKQIDDAQKEKVARQIEQEKLAQQNKELENKLSEVQAENARLQGALALSTFNQSVAESMARERSEMDEMIAFYRHNIPEALLQHIDKQWREVVQMKRAVPSSNSAPSAAMPRPFPNQK